MINVEKAKELVIAEADIMSSVDVNIPSANEYILADDIYAPIDLPPFPQSAMDGYAIKYDSLIDGKNVFQLTGEIKAGSQDEVDLKDNEAIRIFTGAPVPKNTTAIVMQEKVNANKTHIEINSSEINPGDNIRIAGEQIKEGSLALGKGTLLTPAAIGYLCSLGLKNIKVINRPKVSIIGTGDELVSPGSPLKFGQIYESNTAALHTLLTSSGFEVGLLTKAKDNFDEILDTINKARQESDVVIISGGISVGDYDYVGAVLNKLGVKEIFYKVNQKPGKPLFFGKLNNTLFFALPGNPAASLVCMYEYVLPALKKMSGHSNYFPVTFKLPMETDYTKKTTRAEFLKAYTNNESVKILEGQSSAMLHSFSMSNALVYIPVEQTNIKAGELVEIHMLL